MNQSSGSGTSGSSGSSGGIKLDDEQTEVPSLDDLYREMYRQGLKDETSVLYYLRQKGYTSGDAKTYAEDYIIKYEDGVFDLDSSEKRDVQYDKLGVHAKELLSAIQRQNYKTGGTGLTEGNR